MELYNLIGNTVLKENIFDIAKIESTNDMYKNLIKVSVLMFAGGIIVNKNYSTVATLSLSILLVVYYILNFKKKKIGSDMNNQKGNNLIGNDEELKEVKGKEKFYDTIALHHNDLINKNIMDRNFYRLPNPRRINNQEKYAKWLYYQKEGCKVNTANCFKYETLNNR